MQPRDPRPFTVFENGQFRFVIHAYSKAHAKRLVAQRIIGPALVLPVRKGSPLHQDIYRRA